MTGIQRAKCHIAYTEKKWKKCIIEYTLFSASLTACSQLPVWDMYTSWMWRSVWWQFLNKISGQSIGPETSVRNYQLTCVRFQKSAYLMYFATETWNHVNYEYLHKWKSNRNAKMRHRGWWEASPCHRLLSLARTTDIKAKNFTTYTWFPYLYTDLIHAT